MGAVNLLSAEAISAAWRSRCGPGRRRAAAGDGRPDQHPQHDDIAMITSRRVRGRRPRRRTWPAATKSEVRERSRTFIDESDHAPRRSPERPGRPGHQAGPLIIAQAVQQGPRHPHQPRRGGHPGAVPRRRGALPVDAPPDGSGDGLADQDHGRPRHLLAPRPPGRAPGTERRGPAHRHPRRHPPARPRRGLGAAHPRQGRRRPGPRVARDAPRRAGPLRPRDPPPSWGRARDRAHRVGQVDHPVRRPERAQQRSPLDPHDRGPGRVADRGRQADADRPEGRGDLRHRAALDAARRP